jgi:hypothetical protein
VKRRGKPWGLAVGGDVHRIADQVDGRRPTLGKAPVEARVEAPQLQVAAAKEDVRVRGLGDARPLAAVHPGDSSRSTMTTSST